MNTVDFNNDTSYEKSDRTDFGDINGDGQVDTLKTELTTDQGFMPIGTKTSFSGTFLGNNNEIKNLYEDKKRINILGLFANINNAILQDFTITGNITNKLSSNVYTKEGVVGHATGECGIKNVSNKINIHSDFSYGAVGGIIATIDGEISIENCDNKGDLEGGQSTGGIVGGANSKLQVKNCYNEGKVKNEQTGHPSGNNSGGIVGFIDVVKIEINDCYNNNIVIGTAYTGGICGRGYRGEIAINHCYNKGQVANLTAKEIGAIAGTTTQNTTISNCYNEGEVVSQSKTSSDAKRIGGIAGSSSGKIIKCFNRGIIKSYTACHFMAGIVAHNNDENAIVENCYNAGKIIIEEGNGSQVGGIVGRNWYGFTIKNCYSIGTYTYSSISYLGGINGYNYGTSVISNSYYLNTTATKAYNGSATNVTNCISKTEQEMKNSSFITLLDTGNEESVWRADTNNFNNGYPILKWEL